MKQMNRLHVGLSTLSHHPLVWGRQVGGNRGHHMPRWAPFAWAPVLAVAIAAGGAFLLRSHVPDRPPPVSVARIEARPPVVLPAPPADPSLSKTTNPATNPATVTKDGMMRVEAPPMIIEVTVKR
jgi:hypothetical protein